jgi:allantoin racemase
MVTFAPQMVPALSQTIRDTGHAGRLAGILTVKDWNWSAPGAIQDELFEPLRSQCFLAVQGGGIGSIVLGGGPLAGLAARLQPDLQVPVIDGTTAALGLLRIILGAPSPGVR